jgi:RND family efflux transporter MFP subunit
MRLDGKVPTTSPAKKRARRPKREHLVEIANARTETLHLTSVYSGSLRTRRNVRIHVQEEGRVSATPHFEGDAVRAGALLFSLDAALLEAQLARSVAVRTETESNFKRLSGLRTRRMVGEDEYLRAETAVQVARADETVLRTRLGYAKVTAPFDGIVSARVVEPGDVVARHDHVLTLVDPSSMIIDIQASELLIPSLSIGDEVQIRIDAIGPRSFAGVVARVFPQSDPRTRQGRVEVKMTPIPRQARAGQFARVTFSVEAFGQTVIPFGALRRDRDGEYTYVVDDKLIARRRAVRSGRRLADRVEILEGLHTPERVVLRGFLGLADGKTVKLAKPQ